MTLDMKNPGTRSNAAGASLELQRLTLGGDNLEADGAAGAGRQATHVLAEPRRGDPSVTVLHLGKASHRTAARAVLDTLTLGEPQAYAGLFVILRARLTPAERKALAWAALMACCDAEALAVAQAVIPPEERAGWPVVPFEDVLEEASFWADHASLAELKAYAAVCMARLSEATRRDAA